jgi:hypothetical protein
MIRLKSKADQQSGDRLVARIDASRRLPGHVFVVIALDMHVGTDRTNLPL